MKITSIIVLILAGSFGGVLGDGSGDGDESAKRPGPFFIENASSKRRMFAQDRRNMPAGGMESGVGATKAYGPSPGYANQQWYFEETMYKTTPAYFIVNAATGRYLYAQDRSKMPAGGMESGVGATTSKGYNDQKWYVSKKSICNAETNRCLYAQGHNGDTPTGTNIERGVGATTAHGDADQTWVIRWVGFGQEETMPKATLEQEETMPETTLEQEETMPKAALEKEEAMPKAALEQEELQVCIGWCRLVHQAPSSVDGVDAIFDNN